MSVEKKHINIFDIFRGVAIFSIFLSHLNFWNETNMAGVYYWVSYARLAVDFFFILSGFLLAYGMDRKILKGKEYRDFIIKKIKKFYPLYIATLLIGIIWYWYRHYSEVGVVKDFIIRLLVSLPLLQSLVPIGNIPNSFNGVCWFLSCTFVLYLISPLLLRINEKIKQSIKYIIIAFGLNIVVWGLLYTFFQYLQYNLLSDYNLSLVYSTSYIRVFYYISGILCYDFFSVSFQYVEEKFARHFTFIESSVCLITILWWLVADNGFFKVIFQELINVLILTAGIYIFAFERGKCSRWFTKMKIKKLGSISYEFFMIHYLVIDVGIYIFGELWGNTEILSIAYAIIFFIISVILSEIAHKNWGIPLKSKTKIIKKMG